MRQKVEAEKIISTLIKKKTPLIHEIAIIAIKHLCELLLDELNSYSEEDGLKEGKDLILRLNNIGKSQHSFSIIVEALVLQSKLTLLEGNLEKARHILEQAELTASEKGMKYLEFQVQQEKKIFESEFEKWQELIKNNAKMSEKIEMVQFMEYIKLAQQSMKLK